MAWVSVDRELCEGYGNCVFEAEDVFEIGDDNIVTVLKVEVEDADRSRIETAVDTCPVAALKIVD
jgi:ferredoxin